MKIISSNTSIGSTSALAKVLDVSETWLELFSQNPEEFYSVSEISKKSGGIRIISDPFHELKVVQRRIVRRIFSHCKFPDYLFGSIKDIYNPRDFVRNAQYHANAHEVITFDIESFFPSTHPRFVKKVFKYFFNLPENVADLLVKLTTLNEGLPQGAPTSPYLANFIFYDSEFKLVNTLNSKGYKYSRLVDDITISSESMISPKDRTFIFDQVSHLLAEKKLTISKRKYARTNTSTQGKKTVVTGLVIENKQVKLPKERVSSIGAMVYQLKNKAVVDTTNDDYHRLYGTASGMVSLYKRLNPARSALHRLTLKSIKPTFSKEKAKKIRSLCRKFIDYAKAHPSKYREEKYAKKYYKFKHKLSILRRTHRADAMMLESELAPLKPLYLLASYHE